MEKDHEEDEDLIFLDEDAEEPEEEYLKGGYHRVTLEEKCLGDTYIPFSKLGWGHFSTVWKCRDSKGKEYAVKVVKSAREYDEAAKEEIRLLEALQPENGSDRGSKHVIELLDFYKIEGPHGVHRCLVFPIYAASLLEIIKAHSNLGTPTGFNRVVTRQVTQALEFIHSRHLIHADLKPENVMLTEIPEDLFTRDPPPDHLEEIYPLDRVVVKVIDLGNALRSGEMIQDIVQTRQYRAPEVIIWHPGMGRSMDSWSLGCIMFELITGDVLFDPRGGGEEFSQNEDHLALITELLGPINKKVLQRGELSSKYYLKGYKSFRKIKKLRFWSLDKVIAEKYGLEIGPLQGAIELMISLLETDPEKRILPEKVVEHPWLQE